MIVTVTVSTWNRASYLDSTLTGMRNLHVPEGIDWELLVVNNNCTDGTDEVIARHARGLPLRRLFEADQGLSNARNLAVAEARGDLILFTDDDVVVDSGWMAAYVEAARNWPEADYFGGTIDPLFEAEPSGWIRRHLKLLSSPFGIHQFGEEIRFFRPSEAPFGANMAFRREVLGARPFDSRLGRCGDEVVNGEETALFERLAASGVRGLWVGTARVQHRIPLDHMTEQYLYRWYRGAGRTLARCGGVSRCERFLGLPRRVWELNYVAEPGTALLSILVALSAASKGSLWMRAFQVSARMRGFISELRQ
ncbi:MAG: glycosyltransferase [Isosphaeraceae bacterium]|nr:glycosyltransferase [Isosphaeraceae bacterium]